MKNTLPFIELLEILQKAHAIQWDDFLIFPTVNITDPEDEAPTFEILTPHDEWLIFDELDVSDCYIDEQGDIIFISRDKTYSISILERKKLVWQ